MNTLNCFLNFKCTMDKCSDNCCIGWGIDIDDETRDFYKGLSCGYKDVINKNIDFESSSIIMKDDGRCPFLNENNLCDIILNLGEEHISYICTNHPRFFNEFDTHMEMGFGLCCEEAARLLLKADALCETFKVPDNPLFLLRSKLFEIINNKELLFKEKLYYFLDIICGADDLLFDLLYEEIPAFVLSYSFKMPDSLFSPDAGLLKIIKGTEPIDKRWEDKLDNVISDFEGVKNNIEAVINKNKGKYEKLLYYYTFRYLLKDIEDNELISKGKFILTLVILNIFFDAHSYFKGQDDFDKNTVLISKQLEYSEDNLCYMYNAVMEEEEFSFDNILKNA